MENGKQYDKLLEAGDSKILFLDISAACTGYAVGECDFVNRKAVITKAGAIWFSDKMEAGEKYNYLSRCITEYFYVMGCCDYLVHEQYAINMKQRSGVMVTPEMIGAVKSCCAELGIKYDSITPQTWRKFLGVKPAPKTIKSRDGSTKEVKDYKQPTIDIIDKI